MRYLACNQSKIYCCCQEPILCLKALLTSFVAKELTLISLLELQ